MATADAREAEFKRFIVDLRFEGDQVFSSFEVIPEHWRDDFDAGRTPREALERRGLS